jgi:hypothetical protein
VTEWEEKEGEYEEEGREEKSRRAEEWEDKKRG